jgi:hypothetical protein
MQYADFLSVLTFKELKDSPLTEKFTKRQRSIIDMRFVSFWDKCMIATSMNFVPLLNLVLINLYRAYKVPIAVFRAKI